MLSFRFVVPFLALCGLAHAQPPAPPPVTLPERLTMEDALRIFRQRGLDLLIAEAAVQSAEGDLRSAAAIINPQLGFTYSHVFTYQPNDPSCVQNAATCSVDGFGLDLNDQAAISDILSGKRKLRLKVAGAALAAARMARADAQRTLEFQVKQTYIGAVLARDALDFALEVQKGMTQTYDLMHLRYQAGAISEADEAKVETAKLEADQAVDTAAQALRVAKLSLAFLLGVRAAVPDFHVDQDLPTYQVPNKLLAATRESMLQEAFDHRPDLKGQRFQQDRAVESLRLAKRLRFPDIALDLNFQQIGAGGIGTNAPLTPPQLGVGLSAPIPVFYLQQGEIKKAEADLKTQTVQHAKVEAQVVNDVETAWTNLVSSRKLVERMQARLLDRAKRARDLIELQYKKGAASLLEFLDAQRTWIANNEEYLQDLTNYWTALFQLEQAVGMDLR
jgi:cobalt-zinc-cadmium efflux system outer membrane protein